MQAVKTFLLTGVTGQIGSALASLLKGTDYRILYLIRSRDGKSAQDRLKEVLGNLREGLDIAIEGDITLKNAGVSNEDILRWTWEIDTIVHAAAAISFEESEAQNTVLTNLDGTRHMLDLAEIMQVENFHYVSTAYVSGSARTFSEADLDVGQTSFNPYERSKIDAEKMVKSWKHGNYSIHRLSTVLGDSITGKVQTFHSYYGFFIPFWRLLKTFEKKWQEEKSSCVANGVSFSDNGVLSLPLCIDCSDSAVLNLTTCDWVVNNLMKLIEIPCCGQTFHLVNANPPKVKWVIETSLKILGISDVTYGQEQANGSALIKRIQSGLDRGINKYRQYIKHGTVFEVHNLPQVLGGRYQDPPVIDEALLRVMLDYARSVNFGDERK